MSARRPVVIVRRKVAAQPQLQLQSKSQALAPTATPLSPPPPAARPHPPAGVKTGPDVRTTSAVDTGRTLQVVNRKAIARATLQRVFAVSELIDAVLSYCDRELCVVIPSGLTLRCFDVSIAVDGGSGEADTDAATAATAAGSSTGTGTGTAEQLIPPYAVFGTEFTPSIIHELPDGRLVCGGESPALTVWNPLTITDANGPATRRPFVNESEAGAWKPTAVMPPDATVFLKPHAPTTDDATEATSDTATTPAFATPFEFSFDAFSIGTAAAAASANAPSAAAAAADPSNPTAVAPSAVAVASLMTTAAPESFERAPTAAERIVHEINAGQAKRANALPKTPPAEYITAAIATIANGLRVPELNGRMIVAVSEYDYASSDDIGRTTAYHIPPLAVNSKPNELAAGYNPAVSQWSSTGIDASRVHLPAAGTVLDGNNVINRLIAVSPHASCDALLVHPPEPNSLAAAELRRAAAEARKTLDGVLWYHVSRFMMLQPPPLQSGAVPGNWNSSPYRSTACLAFWDCDYRSDGSFPYALTPNDSSGVLDPAFRLIDLRTGELPGVWCTGGHHDRLQSQARAMRAAIWLPLYPSPDSSAVTVDSSKLSFALPLLDRVLTLDDTDGLHLYHMQRAHSGSKRTLLWHEIDAVNAFPRPLNGVHRRMRAIAIDVDRCVVVLRSAEVAYAYVVTREKIARIGRFGGVEAIEPDRAPLTSGFVWR